MTRPAQNLLARCLACAAFGAGALACGEESLSPNPSSFTDPVLDAGVAQGSDDASTPETDAGSAPVVVDAGAPDSGQVDMGTPDAGEPECRVNADCSESTPFCDQSLGMCTAPPPGGALGWGDGSMGSVDFEVIHTSLRASWATDLAFSNLRANELWVVHREPSTELPCSQVSGQSGCAALQGSTTTIFDPGTPMQREEWIQDFNAWHFMRKPPALAFGVDGFFATCGEARTGNFLDDLRADFIGPSLWTSDPAIYRNWSRFDRPSGWNGTHMDMLHATPYCMGIAHEEGNTYWVANGQIGSLDRYDFNADHGPGQADHSDGEVYRYVPGTLTRVADVPGHMVFHEGQVFAADTGAGRVIAFNPEGATRSGPLSPRYEPLQDSATFAGGTVTEVIAPGGILQQPSGLEIREQLLYVSDAATSQLHAFDLNGTLVRSLDTGLPPGSLAGITFSPSGQLYFVDKLRSRVLRVVPK